MAIFGPSGSGKTTLLLLAAGLLRADAGSVRFEGRDLAALSKREVLAYRRTKLGFVFQNFNLVAGSDRRGERRDAAAVARRRSPRGPQARPRGAR